jgi:hypothetical protein
MKLACLGLLIALAAPSVASVPFDGRTAKKKPQREHQELLVVPPIPAFALPPPPKLISDELTVAILFPFDTWAKIIADRIEQRKRESENGGQGHDRGPLWPFTN